MKSERNSRIWQTIDQIRIELGLSHSQMADILSLTLFEYKKLQQRNREPSVSSTMNLTKALNIGFDSLHLNQFDYRAVVQHYKGNKLYLPEKYSIAAFGKRRIVLPLLQYIENQFGQESRSIILREFQMTEEIINQPHASINLRFAIDIGNYILRFHNNPQTLVDMGKYAVFGSRCSEISTLLKDEKTAFDVVDKVATTITPTYIDANYQWQISTAHLSRLTLHGRPDPSLMEIFGPHYVHSKTGCLIRQGFISASPSYSGLPVLETVKTACVSQGDNYCRLEVIA